MLSRGFYDVIAFWPVVAWPLVFSSCLYAIVRVCQVSREGFGVAPLDARFVPDAMVLYLFFPAAVLFELAAHGYLLWTIGYWYTVMAIPIYIFGWILLPALLDGMRTGLSLLAVTHLLFVAAFATLLGFMDIAILRALNSDLYALVTGLPVAL